MWRTKTREFKIFAADNLLLLKMLFYQVCFKASFEGQAGRAVTDGERKEENSRLNFVRQRSSAPCLLLLVKMRKILSAEEEGG